MKEEQPSIPPTHLCSPPCIFFKNNEDQTQCFPLGLTRGYWTRWAEIIADLAVGFRSLILYQFHEEECQIIFNYFIYLFYFMSFYTKISSTVILFCND